MPERSLALDTPKNHKRRTVPIPGFVINELEKHVQGKGLDDLVFRAALRPRHLSDDATEMPSQNRTGGSHGHHQLHSLWSQTKLLPKEREAMNGHVYGMSEIVGTSTQGVDDAIRVGVQRAARTVRGLDWFEVTDIRGHLAADGEIEHFQVTLKVGFRMEDPKQR
jgi:dodecin